MKLELSVNVEYLKNWKAYEGVREIIQNGVDAEVEFSAPLEITHYNNTLRIENDGVTLPREALLFGTTTKADRKDLIGEFGEGLKLGTLALVRAGHAVKIRSGSEVWTPSIARSEKYDADVLVFDIKDGAADKKRVRVEIGGITDADWKELRTKFLFLAKLKEDNWVQTTVGDLLLDSKFKGQVFCKGIFVQNNPSLGYGYNFIDADLDRDRKMVYSWDLRYKTASIWNMAVASRPDLMESFFELVEKNRDDIHGFDAISPSEKLSVAASSRFANQYGDNAAPVATLAESKDIEHLGARGIVVSDSYRNILAATIGTKDSIEKRLREEVKHKLSWDELNDHQKNNLEGALAVLTSINSEYTLSYVDVVSFNDKNQLGQYKDGRILVSTGVLDSFEDALAVLVHEFAHFHGADGDHSHVLAMHNLWKQIVKHLRAENELCQQSN